MKRDDDDDDDDDDDGLGESPDNLTDMPSCWVVSNCKC
jgi:hypothetical protein